VPNWKGPAEIIDINDTNAKIKLKNKIKVLNVAKLTHFFKIVKKYEDEEDDTSQNFNQNPDQALKDFSDIFNQAHSDRPITRAKDKIIEYKYAAQLALILLKRETENIDSLCNPSDHCAECESKDTYFEKKICFNSSGVN
jgi:hypothetical protein